MLLRILLLINRVRCGDGNLYHSLFLIPPSLFLHPSILPSSFVNNKVAWFDRRTLNTGRYAFHAADMEARPAFNKEVRGGGSVPSWYRDILAKSGVEQVVAEAIAAEVVQTESKFSSTTDDDSSPIDHGAASSGGGVPNLAVPQLAVTLRTDSGHTRVLQVGRVVLGTGTPPDCTNIPLIASLQAMWPVDIIGGLPALDHDLRWAGRNVYVMGGLAGLRMGPDAVNLMGARRAAEVIAQHLGVYENLEEEGNVFANAFALLDDDDTSNADMDDGTTDDETTEDGKSGEDVLVAVTNDDHSH